MKSVGKYIASTYNAETREARIAGDVGRKIVGLDIDDLMDYLQTAYCDEWLAYHQYWIGAKIVEGQMRPSIQKELEEHAEDEEKHAEMIAERIIQLGGTPVLDPQEWKTYGKCGFSAPKNANVIPVLEQNVKAEQCAIEFYNELLQLVSGVDEVTAQMVREILKDEVEHEDDLQMLQRDLLLSKL